MTKQQIIMHFTFPPSPDDIEVMAASILETLPEEILAHCEGVVLRVEEFPDEATEADLDLDDPYDLLALYKSGKEIAPGIEKKTANDDDVLILYRRPLLDMWCDTAEDLNSLLRQVMIEEIARQFGFAEDEIEDMAGRHYQGAL